MTSLVSLPQAAAWSWVLASYCGLEGDVVLVTERLVELAPPEAGRADALVGGDELAGDVGGALGVERRAHGAAQHDGAAGHLGLDVGAGHEALAGCASRPLRSAPTSISSGQDLLALGVEEEGVGLAELLGDQEHAVGRLHDGVDLVGIGDEHVLELERETAPAATCRGRARPAWRAESSRGRELAAPSAADVLTRTARLRESRRGREAETETADSSSAPAILLKIIRMVCQPS